MWCAISRALHFIMKKLSDRIWETRKCRINQEARMVRHAWMSEFLIPWYSLHLVVFALVTPVSSHEAFSALLIAGSTAVLVFSVLVSSARFRAHARDVREQYITMAALHRRAMDAELREDSGTIREIAEKYDELLRITPNHAERDYSRLKIALRTVSPGEKTVSAPSCMDYVRSGTETFGLPVLFVLLLLAPATAFLVLLCT